MKSTYRLLKYKPPRIAQFLAIFAVALHATVPARLDLFSNTVLGSLVIVIGFCVMMAAWWLFRQRQTPICPTDTPSSLVAEGVYRVTRHPMYFGMFAMLLGVALIVGSLPFYIAAIAFLVAMDRVFCPYEEDKMQRLFGDDYLRYKQEVRRWL